MKKLFFISALTTINALACPDFTGRYETKLEMNIPAIQQITQYGCESMEIAIYDESGSFQYYSYHWNLDGKDQIGPLGEEQLLSGQLYDDVFHWTAKDQEQNTMLEAWDSLLDNGDIERVLLEKLPSGQVVTRTSILKKVSNM